MEMLPFWNDKKICSEKASAWQIKICAKALVILQQEEERDKFMPLPSTLFPDIHDLGSQSGNGITQSGCVSQLQLTSG